MAHPEEYPNERISNLSVFKSISILFPRARAAGDPIKYRSSLVTVSAVSQYHTPSIEHIALEFQFFIRYELGYFMVIYQMVSLSVCECAAQRPRLPSAPPLLSLAHNGGGGGSRYCAVEDSSS